MSTKTKSFLKKTTLLGLSASILIFANAAKADDVSSIGDAEKGAILFRACAVCHSTEAGKNLVGPSLHNVVGRNPGTASGYRYSPAMKAHGEDGKIWTAEAIKTFITSPRTVVPRTRMGYPGMRKAEDREDLIAYLLSLSEAGE